MAPDEGQEAARMGFWAAGPSRRPRIWNQCKRPAIPITYAVCGDQGLAERFGRFYDAAHMGQRLRRHAGRSAA